MEIDVVTLFPGWFDWFREQRHVANALESGNRLRALDLREHTPLGAGQVDDTPFGGGAGMVLRVDVMDAALRGFYGVDPVELPRQRRVIAATGLPLSWPDLPPEAVLDCLQGDKKVRDGRVRFVLPTALGAVEIRDDVSGELVLQALARCR